MDTALFWSKVEKQRGCWIWRGYCWPNGYGYFKMDSLKRVGAHRVAYELLKGNIPATLTLDHLCRNRACVNPRHLEPVSLKENVLRGVGLTAQNHRKTHCQNGHPFDDTNTHIDSKGWRWCRTCGANKQRRLRANKAGVALGYRTDTYRYR